MRRLLVPATLALFACHTDSAVSPITPPGGGGFTDAKNMSPGEVRVLTPSQLPNGIELSAGAATTDYLIVVGNSNSTPDVQASYLVKGDLMTGDAARTVVSPSLSVALNEADRAPEPQQTADLKIRAFERSFLRQQLSIPARVAAGTASGARSDLRISPIMLTQLGQQVTINVPNEDSTNLCNSFNVTTGTVKALTTHAAIIVDNMAPAGGFTDTDFNAIAAEFDNTTYPTDASYFGNPTDIDANGRIVLYYTPRVNQLTPAGQQSFVGGFFFAGDLFPPNQCSESNQGEIFYLLAPDPNGQFNNKRTTSQVRSGTRGTVAHEFEHMINAGNRFKSNASAFESTWLDEGLAHTAEDAVGRVVRGFGDMQTLTDADLFVSGDTAIVAAYNAFFGQNLTRLKYWLQRPDTSSGISKHADANLSSRGAIWALLRWTGDQYSGGNFRAYTKRLAAGPDTGVKNLVTASGQPLDSLLAGWMVTNFSDHTSIPGLAAKYNYVGYNMRNAEAAAIGAGYPLQVTTLTAGATISTKSLSGSGTYYRVSVAAGTPRVIMVQDGTGANVSFTGAHYYVLRID